VRVSATLSRRLMRTLQRPRVSQLIRVNTPTRSHAATNRSTMSFDKVPEFVTEVLVGPGSIHVSRVDERAAIRADASTKEWPRRGLEQLPLPILERDRSLVLPAWAVQSKHPRWFE